MSKIFVRIKDSKSEWTEDFNDVTVEQIKNIIDSFNVGLRPGELKREFVRIIGNNRRHNEQ